jgi:AAA+ superfamily predicted ATPase
MEDNISEGGVQPKGRRGSIHKALVEAVKSADLEEVLELLKAGANPNMRYIGEPLLCIAVSNDSREIATALIKNGALTITKTRRGEGILQAAIGTGDMEMVRLLLDAGASMSDYNRYERAPLTEAYESGLTDIFNLLLERGAKATTGLLFAAISRDDEKTVDLALTRGVNVNSRTHMKEATPLHLAVRIGNPKIVKRILEAKPDLDAEDWNEETAYDLAVKLGKKEILDLFEEKTLRCGDYSKKGNSSFRPMRIEDTNFASVVGLEQVKAALNRDLLFPMKHPDLAAEYGVAIKGGILLYGPPGCGKTFITKAVAGEARINIIEVRISDVVSMWAGEHEKNIRKVFESARKNQPCIVFFDEIEFLGERRDMAPHAPWIRGGLNVLLAELDGLYTKNSGILFIGSTNAPWMVDPALKRSGRLGKWIFVPPPDEQARALLFRKYLSDAPIDDGIDYDALARETRLCTSSDIAYLSSESIKRAWQRTIDTGVKHKVTMDDLTACIKSEKYNLGEWYEQARSMLTKENDKRLYSELEEAIEAYEREFSMAANQTYR